MLFRNRRLVRATACLLLLETFYQWASTSGGYSGNGAVAARVYRLRKPRRYGYGEPSDWRLYVPNPRF